MSLALKYRPSSFQDLVGQLHAAQSLKNAIQFNQIAHAYLFYGSRGVGKTSTARILAKCLNCINGPTESPCEVCENCIEIKNGQSIDVLEMDAASNRGIEYIRELRENARFAAMKSKHKIYIIDEVHMLTNESFNALLKILEEPPQKVIFILATTEKNKIPETILSRCQCFAFRKFSFNEIKNRLSHILELEKINFEERALIPLSQKAEGSMRDALSLLDQAIAYCHPDILSEDSVKKVLGLIDFEIYCEFLEAIQDRNSKVVLGIIDKLHSEGTNLKQFIWELIEYAKTAYLIKMNSIDENNDTLSVSQFKTLQAIASKWDLHQLQMSFEELYQLYSNWSLFQSSKSSEIRISIEMALMKIFLKLNSPSVTTLIHRLSSLKNAIETGSTYEEAPLQNNPIKPTLHTATPKVESINHANNNLNSVPAKYNPATQSTEVNTLVSNKTTSLPKDAVSLPPSPKQIPVKIETEDIELLIQKEFLTTDVTDNKKYNNLFKE